jgi:DNA-directed RNA polymerase subunit RPC12/RpoP
MHPWKYHEESNTSQKCLLYKIIYLKAIQNTNRRYFMEKCSHCEAEFLEYEKDKDDLICPNCGWSKSTAQGKPKKSSNIKNMQIIRALGIIIIIIGVASFFTVAGIIEIFCGAGILKLKRRSYNNAITLMWIEIVASAVVIIGSVIAAILLIQRYNIGGDVAKYLVDKSATFISAGIIGLIINIPLGIIFRLRKVRETFWQLPY